MPVTALLIDLMVKHLNSYSLCKIREPVVLTLNEAPCHEDASRSGGIAPCVLNLNTRTLGGGDWLDSRPGRLNPG